LIKKIKIIDIILFELELKLVAC